MCVWMHCALVGRRCLRGAGQDRTGPEGTARARHAATSGTRSVTASDSSSSSALLPPVTSGGTGSAVRQKTLRPLEPEPPHPPADAGRTGCSVN